jgi:methyltransferase
MGWCVNQVILGVDSRVVFTVVVAVVALQRLWELRRSNRNLHALRARGGYEVGAGHYPWMVALHTAFLISCVAEVWLLRRPWKLEISAVALAVLVAALALRWWVLATLGERWTTRVMVLPDRELVMGGPYRWLRHPNYVVVVLEIAAIPMLHTAWMTAVIFSVANLLMLRVRIAVEDRALGPEPGGAGAAESGA